MCVMLIISVCVCVCVFLRISGSGYEKLLHDDSVKDKLVAVCCLASW